MQDRVAARRLADEPVLGWDPPCRGASACQGMRPGPTLILGDQSEIALMRRRSPSPLDHRMALLAEPGDVVVTCDAAPDFEDYARRRLGLGDVIFLASGRRPVAQACHADPDLFARLRATGARTVLPYLTTGHAWHLAAALAEAQGAPVAVSGPTPHISRRCNDKLWFARLVRDVLGDRGVPPACAAYGPAGAAGLAARFLRDAGQVVVKVPDSAGSVGNVRLDRSDLVSVDLAGLRKVLLDRLAATGWDGAYPILVGVWEQDVVASPSVQLWIPRKSAGPPFVEAVTEQHLTGTRAAFSGGRRSALPGEMQDRLREEAARIAVVLQRLGYFGQCSLDAVLSNGKGGTPEIHWIECNGRWGGMSIPLAVAERLGRGADLGGLAVIQEVRNDLPVPDMAGLEDRLSDVHWTSEVSSHGVVVLSPPRAAGGFLLNLMSVAPEQDDAEALLEDARARAFVA